RLELPVDHIETGRLSGAVRPDHGKEFTSRDIEADIVDRAHAAECLGQRANLKDLAHDLAPALRQIDEKAPTIPCGNASTSSRMISPRSARQYSVCRITVSCRVANTDAPTIGPVRVWMPPSSTITRPSIERPT